MRRACLAAVALLLVAGCGTGGTVNLPTPSPEITGRLVTLPNVTIAAATTDVWRHMQQTLQSPVDAYAEAWGRAFASLAGFNPTVAVAALDKGDPVSAFCANTTVPFDVRGHALLYCRSAHNGPDPLPQNGAILVPYRTYMAMLPDVGTSVGQVQARVGTALLLALAYTTHVLAQLQARGLPVGELERLRAHADCLAGVTLRAYVPPPIDLHVWREALTFVQRFQVVGLPSLSLPGVMAGHSSGQPRGCL